MKDQMTDPSPEVQNQQHLLINQWQQYRMTTSAPDSFERFVLFQIALTRAMVKGVIPVPDGPA